MASTLVTHANSRTDPTQTTVIRAQFATATTGRFRALRRAVLAYLEANPGFRLGPFFSDEFMRWLAGEEARLIFEAQPGTETQPGAWMRPYLTQAFIRGLRHADDATGFKGVGVRPALLDGVLNYQNEIDVIQAQNFRLLSGITEVMNLQIKGILIEGIVTGMNPREVGRLIADRVDKIGATRGEILARTEVIRAHAEATLTRFGEYGIGSVSGQAEWLATDDARTCELCKEIDGQVLTIAEARGKLPRHPRCRCCWLPVVG